jgi:1-acyl-sn-glycerol-3-phosphate acyltransferase
MRVVATALGMRLRVEGLEHVPSGGGYIVAAAPHRTWLDPFVLLFALPAEPRIYFLGDGEAMYRDPLRALFVRRLGGVVPIWRGSRGIEGHVAAIGQILAAGAVVALFPERGPAVPTERARPFAAGVGYLALRTGAPVVPAVIGGTHELYLRRRVVVRFLSPTPPPHAVHADHAERALAHAFRDALYAVVAPHVGPLVGMVEPGPWFKKRWRWLTNAFR